MFRLLNEINRIRDEKKRGNRFPTYALRLEVHVEGLSRDETDAYARELERRGLIRIGRTINDSYYELKQKNQ